MSEPVDTGSTAGAPAPAPASGNSARAAALAKWAEIEPEAAPAQEAKPVSDAVVPADKPPEAKPEDKPPAEDGPKTPEIAALARREKFQREQHARRMSELRAKEAEVAEKLAKVPSGDFEAEFSKDPVGTLRKYGIKGKLADAAKALWLEEVGDAAPQQYKDEVWKRRIESELRAKDEEIARVRKEREEERLATQANAVISQYQGGIRDAFTKAGDSHPHVKAYMAEAGGELLSEMWDTVVRYGQANPQQELPTPEEVLGYAEKMLEHRARPFRAMMGSKVEQTGQKAESAGEPPTLSERTSAPTRATATSRSVDEVKSKLKDDLDRIDWG